MGSSEKVGDVSLCSGNRCLFFVPKHPSSLFPLSFAAFCFQVGTSQGSLWCSQLPLGLTGFLWKGRDPFRSHQHPQRLLLCLLNVYIISVHLSLHRTVFTKGILSLHVQRLAFLLPCLFFPSICGSPATAKTKRNKTSQINIPTQRKGGTKNKKNCAKMRWLPLESNPDVMNKVGSLLPSFPPSLPPSLPPQQSFIAFLVFLSVTVLCPFLPRSLPLTVHQGPRGGERKGKLGVHRCPWA